MTRVALAVDVGGTKLEAALVRDDGAVLAGSRTRRPTGPDATPEDMRAALTESIGEALKALPAQASPLGVGIGSAGPIDLSAGAVNPVNMPGIHGYPLVAAVREIAANALSAEVPVVLALDGACLALAESWLGATRDARSSLAIVVSTGIGGGFVIDGHRIAGAGGNAGHLGQMRIGEGAVTVEATASGPASVAWARSQGWTGRSGEDLGSDAASGDPIARAAIERSAATVGAALADAATLMDLDVVAIGGGFSRVSEDYVDLVQAALVASATLPYSQRTRVLRSRLGDAGPLIGAAALVMRG